MSKNKSMNYNFSLLKERVIDTLKLTNVNKQLNKIKGPTICVGSGGSNVVAAYASLVLNVKNNCCTKIEEPRDVLYENIKKYQHIHVLVFFCCF